MAEAVSNREALSPTIAFRTLGCKVNRAESDGIAAVLSGLGVRLVVEEEADVVVVNTCTVTAEADRKARKAVRRALKMPGRPVVVVTGCLAVADAPGLKGLSDRVIVEGDKESLLAMLRTYLRVEDAASGRRSSIQAGEGFRTRVVVKVQDGCDCFCTYCIVPHVRGRPRSVPFDEVVDRVDDLVEAGVAEVVLTGINLGRYASDGAELPELLRSVAATGVRRLRISSIEPLDLTERLLGTIASIPALCPHLHVPLQSGSDRVLAAMGRGYSLAEFSERIEALREVLPGAAVTTDVMTGFPGETDLDATATVEAVQRLGFARLHVFRYSSRERTAAARMSGRVDPGVSSKRAALLRQADARLRETYAMSRIGGKAEVLVEKVWAEKSDTLAEGTTEDYLTLRFAGTACAPGDVVEVRLVSYGPERLLGKAVFPGVKGLA